MKSFTDQCDRMFSLAHPPKRIISLVPSLTELLVHLGQEAKLVGITKFCVHPVYLRSHKTIVGGTKNVRIEKVAALQPDFIIANKEENTAEIVAELERICPVYVSDIASIDDNIRFIADLGEILNCRTESARIAGKIQFAADELETFVSALPEITCAYLIWKNPWMAAGNGTFIHHMMARCKFRNIYGNRDRYPEIELRKMRLEGDPDAVLLSSEPYPFKEEDAFEVGRFTHHAKVTFVDGEMFSWYGSRPIEAFRYFRKLRERMA